MKFLIIRFSSIGDIVLTSPVIRCLKQQVEGAEIHFITKEKHACLLNSNPYVSKVHLFNDKLSTLLDELEKEGFDYVIDLHQNIRSNRIKSRLKAQAFTFEKLNYKKWLLVNLNINTLPDLHIVDRYLDTLSVFNIKNDNQGLDFFVDKSQPYDFKPWPDDFKSGFVAFVIAGTYFTKCLPVEKVIEICNKIAKPIVLLGGKSEVGNASQISSMSSGLILNLCGKTSLNESAQIIEKSNIVLSNDTGLMHVAAAFKKKILSFWGNTVPALGMYPYQADPASKIMEIKSLKCRPCSKLGYDKCPKKHFKCMLDISTIEVCEWVDANFKIAAD